MENKYFMYFVFYEDKPLTSSSWYQCVCPENFSEFMLFIQARGQVDWWILMYVFRK